MFKGVDAEKVLWCRRCCCVLLIIGGVGVLGLEGWRGRCGSKHVNDIKEVAKASVLLSSFIRLREFRGGVRQWLMVLG